MKTNINKTNVAIKFNSVEEYREIEKKLIGWGYSDKHKEFNDSFVDIHKADINYYVYIDSKFNFIIIPRLRKGYYTYNSLQEFLEDV